MASTKEEIERECEDCGRWACKGQTVTRAVREQPGVRVSVWICGRCLVNVRNVEQIEAALERRRRLERRTLGIVRGFRC
jgi:hypothetical protein